MFQIRQKLKLVKVLTNMKEKAITTQETTHYIVAIASIGISNARYHVKTPQQKRRNTKTPRVHNAALQKRRTIIMKSGIQSLDVEDNPDYP
jgi:hypothetical protein